MIEKRFKPHLVKIERKRTSVGRDLEYGLRLDRNERVTNFPKKIIKDMLNQVPDYIFNTYPDVDSLYAKLAGWLGVKAEEVYITNAITEGIRIVFETVVSPNDKVIVLSPTFPMYEIYAKIYQADYSPLYFKSDLSLDLDSLLNSIDNKTCLVCLPNPNLPIENFFSLKQIRRIADKCKECDSILAIDEAYAFFGAETALPLIREFDNIIVFQTFSKAFGLAGIRLGYMVSIKNNIDYLMRTRSLVESNGISMAIGEYMLEHAEIMKKYTEEVKEGAEYVKEQLKKLGYRFHGGSYTNGMLIFLESKDATEDLLRYLKKEKIYLRGSFEPPIDNCIRLTLGPKPIMEKVIVSLLSWGSAKKI